MRRVAPMPTLDRTSSPRSSSAGRLFAGLLLALSLLLFAPQTATAATSSRTFTAYFTASLQSKSWSQAEGSTTISANLTCANQFGGYYVVRLYKEGFFGGGQKGPTVEYSCFKTVQYQFTGLKSGNYHFIMSSAGYADYSGSGKIIYPV